MRLPNRTGARGSPSYKKRSFPGHGISQDRKCPADYCPLRVGFLHFLHSRSGASTGKLLSITLRCKVWKFVHFRCEQSTHEYQNLAHIPKWCYAHICTYCIGVQVYYIWDLICAQTSLSQTCPAWVSVRSCQFNFPCNRGLLVHVQSKVASSCKLKCLLNCWGPSWTCKDEKGYNSAQFCPIPPIPAHSSDGFWPSSPNPAITAVLQAPVMASPTSGRVFDNAKASSSRDNRFAADSPQPLHNCWLIFALALAHQMRYPDVSGG